MSAATVDQGKKLILGLKCGSCGATHSTSVPYTCPHCGPSGLLDVVYDYPSIAELLTVDVLRRRKWDHWRYRELLPLSNGESLPELTVGGTPLTHTPALAKRVGVRSLYLKDDGRNASGSLKDRASSIAVVRAKHEGHKIVACASTGNAASSLAGMAASLGLKCVIFLPERAPEPKIAQLLIFGATVIRVRGSYDDAFRLCQQSCQQRGWYNRNAAINPYLLEGKKTAGFEICEQLDWRPPDWVAVSVGDGCTVAGIWKAFREMREIGLTDWTPRILGVQAAGAAPVTAAFRSGESLRPITPETIADSIAVGVPRNWKKAVLAIRESGGTMINVSDEEILEAMRMTGRLAGVFAEPAAATAVAGVLRAATDGVLPSDCDVAALITGNGLKDVRAAATAAGKPHDVTPDGWGLDAVLRTQDLL